MNRCLRYFVWIVLILCWQASTGCQTPTPAVPRADKADAERDLGLPGKFTKRESQFVFLSDVDLSTNQPLFRELNELREQVFKQLQLPHSNRLVQVYLFEDRDRYERFIHAKYPELPLRKAFFVAQPRYRSEDLFVYAYWGDKIHQDLRHELTHALLHSVLKTVPLWLDEGLAEYFELPPAFHGVNFQHVIELEQGLEHGRKVDMARLERLTKVDEMKTPEYRESWAWVHFMLHSSPKARQVLLQYLQTLRTATQPELLRPGLAAAVPDLDAALQRHLIKLDPSRMTLQPEH